MIECLDDGHLLKHDRHNLQSNTKLEIAPGIQSIDWLALKLDSTISNNWIKGAELIEKRIRGRYLRPMEVLIEKEKGDRRKSFGFIIMSIDCLLIEAIQQFKEGNEETKWKDNKKAFKRFFNENIEFRSLIGFEGAFYDDVRCGLLHQAELKGNWKLNVSGRLISKGKDGFVYLNRMIFHECIIQTFERYIDDLKNNNECNNLRDKAILKMSYICSSFKPC